MRNFTRALAPKSLAKCERGATAIEYALVAALIAVALSSSFLTLGTEVSTYYGDVETEYAAANQ